MATIGAGRVLVRVKGHQLGESAKGTPYVAVLFEDGRGDVVTWYGYLTAGALPRTVDALGVLGWDAQEHGGDVRVLNGTGLLVGARAQIVVEEDEYGGKVRSEVKWVNPVPAVLGAARAGELADELRDQLMQIRPKEVVVREEAVEGAGFDDDLPF